MAGRSKLTTEISSPCGSLTRASRFGGSGNGPTPTRRFAWAWASTSSPATMRLAPCWSSTTRGSGVRSSRLFARTGRWPTSSGAPPFQVRAPRHVGVSAGSSRHPTYGPARGSWCSSRARLPQATFPGAGLPSRNTCPSPRASPGRAAVMRQQIPGKSRPSGALHVGNAEDDAVDYRGWFVGGFVKADNAQATDDVEIKWGLRPPGDTGAGLNPDENATTRCLLVSGRSDLDSIPGLSPLLARATTRCGAGHQTSLARPRRLGCHRPLALTVLLREGLSRRLPGTAPPLSDQGTICSTSPIGRFSRPGYG
ncbi:MAG: signal peptidase [Actinobacteria bacterium]|nr:signal peptidase [Actinomycetota bacterium]